MRYLLDSNICIAILKHQPQRIQRKLSSIPMGQVGISSIVLAELRYGIDQSTQIEKNEEALVDFLEFFEALDWPNEAARYYPNTRSGCRICFT